MAQIALSNTAPETVLVGDISSSTGTIIVESGTGSAFPAVPFRVGIDREAMLVTDVTGDTFTVTRGYDGTASAPHVSGDTVQHIHTATDFPFRVDDTTGLYHGQAGIDMETFAVTNVGEFALSPIGGDIANVGSITSNSGANLVLKPNGATENVQLATSTGKKRIVAETDNIRFYTANGLSETLVWDEAGIEWELQAKFNVNSQPFVGIDALVSDATKNLVLRPADSDKAVRINNYLDDIRIAVAAADITFYQGDGTTPTLAWNDASTEWQLAATFNVSGENITGVEVLASSADQDLSLRPGNAAYAVNLEAADGSDRITVETNDIRFFKADGLTETLKWDQAGDEWEFGAAINANTYTLSNVADPTDDSHVGDRGYNDGRYAPLAGGGYLPLTGGTLSGSLFIGGTSTREVRLNDGGYFTIDFADATAGWARLFRFEYAPSSYAGFGGYGASGTTLHYLWMGDEAYSGSTNFRWYSDGHLLVGGYLDMNGHRIEDPLDPTAGNHVGDRDYNDARYAAIVAGGYLPLSGGTMTGDIDMAGNNLEAVDALLYLDSISSDTTAYGIYLRTDDATGTRRNRLFIDGDGVTTFYDPAGAQQLLMGTSYAQFYKNVTIGGNTLYGVADPTDDTHVGDRGYNDGRYALDGTGVTNGDLHDHSGGDGAAISHADLIGVSASQHHVRYTDAEAIAAVGTVMNGVPSGASLPLTGIAGDLFFLTTDEKLYRHNGTTWLVTTATSDLSGTITETQIEDNAITTGKLDANAVTAAKIEAGTITTAEIATDTILAGNIAAGAIEASEIATGAVTADAILAGAVTTDAMTANTIDGDRILANSLDAAKITAGTITTDRMTAGTIDADRLIADSITSTQIDAGTITTTELAANLVLVTGQAISASYSAGVSGWQIQQSGTAEFNEVIVRGALIGQAGSSISADYLTAGTIDASTIFVENIDADNITAGTLSADRIAAGSLDASKITAGTITTDRMTANTIDGSVITAGSLDAAKITAGSITTDRMTAGTIDADRLTALSIEAAQINTGAITTDKMTAGTIDADRLIANSITATEIASGTITTTELQADMVLVAGQALSASYVLNTSGWKIWQDGSAEFNNVTVRGALIAQAGSTISADYLTAGTIDAAVIDVTNLDAGNITVGTLSADRIAAGSLNAVKIEAGSITTDRMTIDSINGDRISADSLDAAKIVAGSITTDRMTANTIKGDRIEGGTLDAVKITAGSMTTTQFSADTISGTVISTESLNADRLVAGSIGTDRMTAGTINADRLTAGSVTATQLAADSVTAGKLSVQTMSNNLMPNPDFVWDSIGGSDDPHEYSTTYGGSFSAGTARLTGGVRSLRYTYGTGGPGTAWSLLGGTGLGKFPAKEGDKFYVSMWVRTVGTAPLASPYYVFNVNYRQADATYIGADQPGSVSLTTSWTKVSVTGTAPVNTSYFNVFLNHEYTGSETGAETVEYSNIVVERVSPTVLIEDGAITTDKLYAEAVTAEKIEAGTITANEIDTDTITADRWVGDLTLVAGQAISGSYSAGVSGWQISQDGTAEFSNVNIRGTSTVDGAVITENLSASAITTGTIGAETITLTNSASSKIQSNNGTSWYIRGDGVALFANVTVTGTVNADAGYLGDLDVTGDLVMDGGNIQTDYDGNNRLVFNTTGLQFYDSSNVLQNSLRMTGGFAVWDDRVTFTSGAFIGMAGDSPGLNFDAGLSAGNWRFSAGAVGDDDYLTLYYDNSNMGGGQRYMRFQVMDIDGSGDGVPQLLIGSSSATYPAFAVETDTGMFRYTSNQVGIATGGSTAGRFAHDGSNAWFYTDVVYAANEVQVGSGSAGDPGFTFISAGTSGMYHSGSAIYLSNAGTWRFACDTSGGSVNGRLDVLTYVYAADFKANAYGLVNSPQWSVWGTTSGMYVQSGFTGLTYNSSAIISGNGSNQVYVGGMTSSSGAGDVRYNGTQIHYVASSRRYKQNIRSFDLDTSKLKDLRFVEYEYIANPEEGRHFGLIAEEVYDLLGEDYILRGSDPTHSTDDGLEDIEDWRVENIDRDAIYMTGLKATIENQESIADLKEEIKDLNERLLALEGATGKG